MSKAEQTKEAILNCARSEFLAKGFRDASLRDIAKACGVTTGAIYRYFPDKDALFCAATQGVLDALQKTYTGLTDEALELARQGVVYGKEDARKNTAAIFDIVYDRFDEFYLIIMCSVGSTREGYVAKLIEYEHESTLMYLRELEKRHGTNFEIDEVAIHMLTESFIVAFLEPVRHRMTKPDAMRRLMLVQDFFADAWIAFEQKLLKNR